MTDTERIVELKLLFASWFGAAPRERLVFAKAPGRLELAGNHTDHQGGCVISAALDRHISGLAAPNGTAVVRARMEGFEPCDIDLSGEDAFEPHEEERGTSAALIRGMAAAYAAAGGTVGGFDLVTTSNLPAGAGVSSSAAFEMLIGVVLRALDGTVPQTGEGACLSDEDRVALALQGQDAERRFFGKTCGAQDQLASAFGGTIFMDFSPQPPAPPTVTRVNFDPEALPFALVLVDSRVDHSRYSADYDSVPADMFRVARKFHCERLGDMTFRRFEREVLGFELVADPVRWRDFSPALDRARHFFFETRRVRQQLEALQGGHFRRFANLANESGVSNRDLLRNVTPVSAPADDPDAGRPEHIMDLCGTLLDRPVACRMHGGGFGGSILVLVPRRKLDRFTRRMDAALGYAACVLVAIAKSGAAARRIPAELPGRVAWTAPSRFGDLEVTINLRKPEKDPRAIAAALAQQAAGVERPCDLCREVRDFDVAREEACDARVAASGVEFPLDGERWMLHFSPYGYYPLHCIAVTEVHRPMAITGPCLARLMACVNRFPYYFMGSNADLPIVGGSILAHDHFQGGGHVFPLMKAGVRTKVALHDYPALTCGIVDWPASTLRLEGPNADELVAAATRILEVWQRFDWAPCGIVARDGDGPHSTITPIAYRRSFVEGAPAEGAGGNGGNGGNSVGNCSGAGGSDDPYVLNLVLRNNRTTPERPFGLFHPDESLHHIKKENIGLIEIMGLAVLPGRLVREIPGVDHDPAAQAMVTEAFVRILESTGVFKQDDTGMAGWQAFLGGINGEIIG